MWLVVKIKLELFNFLSLVPHYYLQSAGDKGIFKKRMIVNHDLDKSSLCLLLTTVPFAGLIIIYLLLIKAGNPLLEKV